MIINGKIVSDYDFLLRRKQKNDRARHRRQGFPGEYRLLLNDDVLDHCPNYGRWIADPPSGLRIFLRHLQRALLQPQDFSFEGCGGCEYYGEAGARDWLAFHQQRLQIDSFHGRISLIGPDDVELEAFEITQPCTTSMS